MPTIISTYVMLSEVRSREVVDFFSLRKSEMVVSPAILILRIFPIIDQVAREEGKT